MIPEFEAIYSPLERRPDKPIKVGRGSSQARVSLAEAKKLRRQLNESISIAEMNLNKYGEFRNG